MGEGVAHPVAAAGVLALFFVTATLLKLARVFYLRHKLQVVEIDTSPKSVPEFATDIEANGPPSGRPATPEKTFDGYSLRVTARPQTPEDIFAMQVQELQLRRQMESREAAELDFLESERPYSRGSMFSERPRSRGSERPLSRGSFASERPRSRTDGRRSEGTATWLERPQSRDSFGRERPFSSNSSCSEGSRQNARPHSSTWRNSLDSCWGVDPQEFWEADVNELWGSPQRPLSKSSKRSWAQDKLDGNAPALPGAPSTRHIAYSSWPAPKKPSQGAYYWTWTTVDSAPKPARVACNEFPLAPERPCTAPAPSCAKSRQESATGEQDTSEPPTWQSFIGFVASGKAKRIAVKRRQEKTVPQDQENCLVESMQRRLQETQSQPLCDKKRIFRDLQRQLHPDKNVDCAAAAKFAFQELMLQRDTYLSEGKVEQCC